MADAGSDRIAVIGAGLAGSMMALMLARHGFSVDLYERRPDFRIAERQAESESHLGLSKDATKRSINLALSYRGQSALYAVGLLDQVMPETIPMPCRAMHSVNGFIRTQPYGLPGEAIFSASRALLNRVLLDACDRHPSVRVHFNVAFKTMNQEGVATLQQADGASTTISPRLVIGADGAYSAVRGALMRFSRTDFSQTYIRHGYKELVMPADSNGDFCMPLPNALHIWPRREYMMIALPNPDRTFTCTLFLPWEAFDRFSADSTALRKFFEANYPDAVPRIPRLEEQFQANPTGALVMVKCRPWNYKDKVLLIGDAAHSVVPFYGQGANAAFEDCLIFAELLDACNGDLAQTVAKFAECRPPATDALADLSMDNYVEMRAKTASRWFLLRKRLEGFLNVLFPTWWIPQYSMVSFTRIPYDQIVKRAKRQDRFLHIALSSAVLAIMTGFAYAAFKHTLPTITEAVRSVWQ